MENNNNNGRGIFYGVIGVATLIVAIIGATFAYFSAAANSATNAVSTGSATVNLSLLGEQWNYKDNLIPMDETKTGFEDVIGFADTDCVDVNGNDICSVYQFTIKNPSTTAAQEIFVTMTPTVNGYLETTESGRDGTTNLMYSIMKGTISSHNFDVNAAAESIPTSGCTNPSRCDWGDVANGKIVKAKTFFPVGTNTITLNTLEQVLQPNEEVTYTIVVWLHEIDDVQNGDQTKTFAAQINVTTEDAGSGVTGKLAGEK